MISGSGYSFTTVDVTATPREGEWPVDAPLMLFPRAYEDATNASDGGLRHIDASAEIDAPDSIPHCKQPVVLDGAGSGHLYVGILGDVDGDADGTPPLGGWVHRYYGVSAAVSGDPVPSDLILTECVVQVTELGAEFGVPTAAWTEEFHDEFCVVGESV